MTRGQGYYDPGDSGKEHLDVVFDGIARLMRVAADANDALEIEDRRPDEPLLRLVASGGKEWRLQQDEGREEPSVQAVALDLSPADTPIYDYRDVSRLAIFEVAAEKLPTVLTRWLEEQGLVVPWT